MLWLLNDAQDVTDDTGACYPLKNEMLNTLYSVEGIVTATNYFGNLRFYIQAEGKTGNAGLEVHEPEHSTEIKKGDKVKVQGVLKNGDDDGALRVHL